MPIPDQSNEQKKTRRTFSNRQQYLESIFDFFYVGKNLNYPVSSFDQGEQLIPAVFLGVIIDKRKKNPDLPSALRLRFAIVSSNKYIAIPVSYIKDVNAKAQALVFRTKARRIR